MLLVSGFGESIESAPEPQSAEEVSASSLRLYPPHTNDVGRNLGDSPKQDAEILQSTLPSGAATDIASCGSRTRSSASSAAGCTASSKVLVKAERDSIAKRSWGGYAGLSPSPDGESMSMSGLLTD